jgi:fucose permease
MSPAVLVFIVSLIFGTLGLNIAILGPSLQDLALRTGSPIETFGFLFTAVSLGYLLSAPVVAGLGRRLSTRAMLAAPAIIVAGLICLAIARDVPLIMFGAALLGFGQASTQVAYTTLLGDRLRGQPHSDAKINRANASYGVGALAGPIIVSLSYRMVNGAGTAFAVAIACSVAMLVIGQLIPLPPPQAQHTTQDMSRRKVLLSPVFLLLVATMAVYVGIEVAFSGWTTEFTKRILSIDVAQASFASSLFFAGLALSRYFANLLLKLTTPGRLIAGMLVVSILGLICMVARTGLFGITLFGSALVGFGLGPVYPTIIALGMRQFPGAARHVSSVLTSSGSIGSITMPPVVGNYIASDATLPTAWHVLSVFCGLTLLFWSLAMRSLKRIAPNAAN